MRCQRRCRHLDPGLLQNVRACLVCLLGVGPLGFIYGLAHEQRLRLNTSREFRILRPLAPNVAAFLEHEGIFHALKRTSFTFVAGFLAAPILVEFDWSDSRLARALYLCWRRVSVPLLPRVAGISYAFPEISCCLSRAIWLGRFLRRPFGIPLERRCRRRWCRCVGLLNGFLV